MRTVWTSLVVVLATFVLFGCDTTGGEEYYFHQGSGVSQDVVIPQPSADTVEAGCHADLDCPQITPFCNNNVCSQYCQQNMQCDDGDPGVAYTCVNGACHEEDLPCAGEWNALGQCVITCDPVDDFDPCTIDGCDPETGAAIHTPKVCDDGDPGTTDYCDPTTGDCYFRDEPICDSSDNNPCTNDYCDPTTGAAVHTLKSCDDGKEWTDDWCHPVTGDCHHMANCPNCSDDNACTLDGCDTLTGACTHEDVDCSPFGPGYECVAGTCEFHCRSDSQCNDGNACTDDECDLETGVCYHPPIDCDDRDPHTHDYCEPNGDAQFTCQHIPTECYDGCDDDNLCTTDYCNELTQTCVYEPVQEFCGPGTVCSVEFGGQCIVAPCHDSADCNDDDACTFDYCEAGVCQFRVDVVCGQDEVCYHGECIPEVVHVGSCGGQCPAGQVCNLNTNQCYDPCGPGTIWEEATETCVMAQADPECEDGGVTCRLFEPGGVVTVAQCISGHWLILEYCGTFNGGDYCEEGYFGPACYHTN